jgi:putative methyltransferase (TIGR04325 family)
MRAVEQTKILIRKVVPPRYGFRGNYGSWEDARAHCTGYDAGLILDKVKEATLKVKTGEAAYERDSVLFNEVEYSWPLLAALMWIAAQNKGQLKVLDFGGSLGSSYFQNKAFLDKIDLRSWSVVEQENFVHTGKEFIGDGIIGFYNSPEEVIHSRGIPDVLILSCTLPYLEQPYQLLRDLMEMKFPYILVDNTYFNYQAGDRICIQKVPPAIYDASYPCWFLDYQKLLENIKAKYTLVSEHQNESIIQLDGHKIRYQGFLAKLNSN